MRILTALVTLCLLASCIGLTTGAALAEAPASAANQSDAEAIDIIEKHLDATGRKRDGGKPPRFVDTVTESDRGGVVEKGRRVEDRATGRFYSLQEGASGKIETGYDGMRGWRRAAFFRGYLDDGDPVVRAARQPRQELSEYRSNGMVIKKLPDETIDGTRYLVLSREIEVLGRSTTIKLFIDPNTYYLRRTEQGDTTKTIVTQDDFRKVDGRVVPFIRVARTPRSTATTRTLSVTFDAPIDERLFQFADSAATSSTAAVNETSSSADKAAEPKPAATTPAVTTPIATSGAPAATNAGVAEKITQQASQKAPAPSRAPDQVLTQTVKESTFQLIWKTINESYWDQTFHGVDWQQVREKYQPRIATQHTNKSFHDLMHSMLGELGRSHLRVTAPHLVAVAGMSTEGAATLGAPRLDMRWLDGELLVYRLSEDDARANAGMAVGDVIESIDGKTPKTLLADYLRDNTGFAGRPPSTLVRAARAALAGPIDKKVTLAIRDHADAKRVVELTRSKSDVARDLRLASKRVGRDSTIGYIRFNYFLGDLMQQFKTALATHKDTPALIVDLRGNGGGIGDLATALASLLSTTSGTLGESKFRYDTRQFSYAASANAYAGKLVFLVDEFSASTTEVLTGGLQHNKRAVVVGERTAGAVLPSLVTLLPSGGAMQYAISDFRLPNQRPLEGEGVVPDHAVKLTRQDLIAGKDAVLERAIALLTE
jgi:carboxyl-terminal processing protease